MNFLQIVQRVYSMCAVLIDNSDLRLRKINHCSFRNLQIFQEYCLTFISYYQNFLVSAPNTDRDLV